MPSWRWEAAIVDCMRRLFFSGSFRNGFFSLRRLPITLPHVPARCPASAGAVSPAATIFGERNGAPLPGKRVDLAHQLAVDVAEHLKSDGRVVLKLGDVF